MKESKEVLSYREWHKRRDEMAKEIDDRVNARMQEGKTRDEIFKEVMKEIEEIKELINKL